MAYSVLKLISDYDSGTYTTRLELGDSGLNGPVDIRFIDDAGWLENVHSVFFSMNGKVYDSGDSGSLITTSNVGDMVFFDPSNAAGRTLSQLYAGYTCWELDGSNDIVPKSSVVSVNMLGKSITTKGATDLTFEVPIGRSFIFKKV